MPSGRPRPAALVALALVLIALLHSPRPAEASAAAALAADGAAAAQGSSYAFYIQNQCHHTIEVAVFYDIPGQGWTVQSWYQITMGQRAGPFYTNNRRYRYFAQALGGNRWSWGGSWSCRACYYGTRGGKRYPFSDERWMDASTTTSNPYTQRLSC